MSCDHRHACECRELLFKFTLQKLRDKVVKEQGLVQHNYEVAQAAREEMEKALSERDRINLKIDGLRKSWAELKAARTANFHSGEFREDDLRAERVTVAQRNLEALLNKIEEASS